MRGSLSKGEGASQTPGGRSRTGGFGLAPFQSIGGSWLLGGTIGEHCIAGISIGEPYVPTLGGHGGMPFGAGAGAGAAIKPC